MNSLSPNIPALMGGCLIGLGSLIALLATGKIPGISGVVSLLLRPQAGDTTWRIVFLIGLAAGAFIAFHAVDEAAVFRPQGSLFIIAVAGLLVGFGTRLGGGCTSGHGVCGIGRGSKSSVVATFVFIAAGVATVWVANHSGWVSLR